MAVGERIRMVYAYIGRRMKDKDKGILELYSLTVSLLLCLPRYSSSNYHRVFSSIIYLSPSDFVQVWSECLAIHIL